MAIEDLRSAQQPNLSNEVGATVEALYRFGLVEDREQEAESVMTDFKVLAQSSGKTGEVYMQLPRGLVTMPTMIAVLDGGTYPYEKYRATYVHHDLWTPGTGRGGYKADDIGNLEAGQRDANWPAHARQAVHNPDNEAEPLLHFLDQPFDEKYAAAGEKTQLQSIAEAKATYEAEHELFTMTPLNVNAVFMIALTRRIKGESMPMEGSDMRDATIPRETVDGKSYVGRVYSFGGQLRLVQSYGFARHYDGVGLSVGQK